jgi:multiple sugar transport system substrate-binding protein
MGEKVSRRNYLKVLGGTVGGLVVGAAIGYLAAPGKVVEKTVERTVTQTVTATATPSPTKKVELVFWHHEAPSHRVAAYQKVLDLFYKETGIKITQQVVSWDEAWTKTLAAIKAGNPPDFEFSIPDLTLAVHAAGGIIPVDEIFNEIDKKYRIFDSVKKCYYWDGHYWGVPVMDMAWVWIYRPSYYEKYLGTTKPPKTWDEALEYAKNLTVDVDKDGKIDIYGMGETGAKNLCTQEFAWNMMTTFGASVFDDEGKVIFDSKETREAFTYYKKFWDYVPLGALEWAWGEIELAFAAGTIAQMPYFPTEQKRFYEMTDPNIRKDLAASPMPTNKIAANIHYPNDAIIFTKTAENPDKLDAVMQFLEFLHRPEIHTIMTAEAEPGGFLPVNEATIASDSPYWKHPIISFYPELNKTAVDACKTGTLYGFGAKGLQNKAMGEVSGALVLAEVTQRIVSGAASVEEAVKWGHEKINEIAAGYK